LDKVENFVGQCKQLPIRPRFAAKQELQKSQAQIIVSKYRLEQGLRNR
jgi:hypothetical protein